jgi:hypothetical protein
VAIQRTVDALEWEAGADKRVKVGISVGCAIFPHDGTSYEELHATAVDRMRRDKAWRKLDLTNSPAG